MAMKAESSTRRSAADNGGLYNVASRVSQSRSEKEAQPRVRGSTPPVQNNAGATGVHTSPAMFADADALKGEAHKDLDKREFDIMDYYKTEGIMQFIGRSSIFGNTTLLVIFMNALWIGIEMDMNKADQLSDAEWYFQLGEYFFFFYFSFEWIVRFGALQRKLDGLRDKWFVFDTGLVTLMVTETALMPLILVIATAASGGDSGGGGESGMGNLSMLRMFRLLRLTRMVRFMRAVPELVTLLKSMTIALRSVLSTLCLLVIFMYIFSIIFRSQLKSDDEYLLEKFGRIPNAMWTLLMSGAFMDSITVCANTLLEESPLLTIVFIMFIFLASFTVLNMLIGLLCEVVTAVAAAEKEKAIVVYVKSRLFDVLESLDADKSGTISKDEFDALLAIPEAVQALDELGVDVPNLVSLSKHLFEADEISRMGIEGVEKEHKHKGEEDDGTVKKHSLSTDELETRSWEEDEEGNTQALTFADFLEMVIRLRADNRPSVLDVVDLRKLVLKSQRQVLGQVGGLEKMNLKLSADMQDVSATLDKFCTQHRALLLGVPLARCPLGQAEAPGGEHNPSGHDRTMSLDERSTSLDEVMPIPAESDANGAGGGNSSTGPGRPPPMATESPRQLQELPFDEWADCPETAPVQPLSSCTAGSQDRLMFSSPAFSPHSAANALRANSGDGDSNSDCMDSDT